MKALIIGGTGLISTPITRALLARADSVTLYNRGRRSQEFAGQVSEIRGDRRDFAAFEQQIRAAGTFDCVIDMVCFRPEEAESDVRAFAGRCGQFVLCSTVDVYARPSFHYPYREGEPLHSLSDYGRNKVLCERVFEQAHADKALNVTILRPAHTYCDSGAIVHSFGWSSSLLDRMRKGKPIIVHGDGQSLWVSAHAEDVAGGFVGALGNTRAYGRAYHLPGEEWLSWNVYHQVVADVLGVKLPELVHIPTDLLARIAPRHAGVCGPNFQYCNIFDTSAARQDLGYRYTIPVRRGFARVVEWMDANDAIANSDDEPFYDAIIAAWRDLTSNVAELIVPLDV
jgi:nucleoside-diphosphate-sugar epimerase